MEADKKILDIFRNSGQDLEMETVPGADGSDITIVFFKHASLGFVWKGTVIYVDPLLEYADYSVLPKADMVLVTHEHYDHLDTKALEVLSAPGTAVVGSRNVGAEYPKAKVLVPGETYVLGPEISVLATAAYNVSPDQLQFHPKERGDNGYVISFGQARVYVAGDTEPIPEMENLGKIDVMFLPVNQPYTMKPGQAAHAARIIGAPLFFPYHTTDTDTDLIRQALADNPSISVRVHNMP